MAIRLRFIKGRMIALCAARSVAKAGDGYLDDAIHHALAEKFRADFASEGYNTLADKTDSDLREIEESNNPARTWWDGQYADRGPKDHV